MGSSVHLVDPDGQNTRDVVGLPNGFGHRFSPDGSRIAFEGFAGCWHLTIADLEPDHENPETVHATNLSTLPVDDCTADITGLTWSPDGSAIVFAAFVANEPQPPAWDCFWPAKVFDIFKVNVDGTGLENLTATAGRDDRYEVNPVYSPDGSKIASQRTDGRTVSTRPSSVSSTPGTCT